MATVTLNLETIRSEFTANGVTSGHQSYPDVAGLGSGGGWVISYHSATGQDIVLDTYDSPGDTTPTTQIVGGVNPSVVSTLSPAFGGLASLAVDDNGNNTLAFYFVGSGGLVAGNPNPYPAGSFSPDMGTSDDGTASVWVENGVVKFQRGSTVHDVSAPGAEFIGTARVDGLLDEGWVVVWSQWDEASSTYDTYARIFDPPGTPRVINGSAGPFLLQSAASTVAQEVEGLSNGNFAVVYTDTGWTVSEAGTTGISLAIWRPDGTRVTEVHVNTPTAGVNETNPDVTVLAGDYIVVSWDVPGSGGVSDTYFRIYDSNGSPVFYDGSNAQRAFSASPDSEYNADVAGLGAGRFVGVWADGGPADGDGSHIAASIHELVRTTNTNSTETGTLRGDAIRDVMTGNGQSNRFEGGGGGDDLRGRGGNDAYVVYAGDRITEGAGEGTADYVSAVESYVLNFGAQVEQMWTDNDSSIDLTGNEFAQTITGNATGNRLDGGGGTAADRLVGRGGSDSYAIRHSGDVIVEGVNEGNFDSVAAAVSYTLAQGVHVESMSMITAAAINLTGNSLVQTIQGNDANNQLDSGGGSDFLIGGNGNDSYLIRSGGETIFEGASQGTTDWLAAAVSYTLAADAHVEQMWTINSGATTAINLTGNIYVQLIVGNAGSNQLDSAGGTTVLRGLGGNDSYMIRTGFETIEEGAGQGTADYLVVSFDYTLAAGVQIEQMWTNSSGGTADIDLTGNSLVQQITGNAGNNRLDSGGGADTLIGLGGSDSYMIRSGTESIVEANGGGSDWLAATVSYTLTAGAYVEEMYTIASSATTAIHLTGNAFSQSIFGNAGANTLTGNGGVDFLTGGRGRDTLWGGDGNDRYIFNAINESGSAIASADRIMDFRDGGGQQDQIDVRLIDASTLAGDQAFVLDTNGSFSTGEIRQSFINGGADLLLEFNNDADASSDMALVLVGITSVRDNADFLF